MTVAGAFLGGASGRLLPASVPLRFFGAAVVYHALGWLVLAIAPGNGLAFRGGLGWPLAALHLFTLGVLGMTALGAAAQLLPVATRQAPVGARALAWIWGLYTPGVAVLALGMGLAMPPLLAIGGTAVAVALATWATLVATNLRRARGMPGVCTHAWSALLSLCVLLASALLLAAGWLGWAVPGRQLTLPLHLLFAPFGFMGLLALGLSYLLVPMFALSQPPHEGTQLASCACIVAALLLAALAVFGVMPAVARALAWTLGSTGVLLHLHLMRRALATGMRKELGRSFLLVKLAWGALLVTLVLGGLLWAGMDLPRAEAAFGLALLAWLLTFVFGMLQRILPFLAALHAAAGKRRGPTASALTHDKALKAHFCCHVTAFAGLALAIALDAEWLARPAAAIGFAGALAFGAFHLHLLRKLRAAGV
ncbi:hypothetical protein [Ramlibacter alkalitolerans]|uniref:NnrS family protein n=1 Tax=Ramlibacter alkalitolerans TaxID=2039631 RepID=A0ABS1JHF5_9BURK|nr:hypothetical protein [Ramlibacter alkalitolerans]MBL0423644.1 hypothetical protein [Ramlibacter alkalitolerans]